MGCPLPMQKPVSGVSCMLLVAIKPVPLALPHGAGASEVSGAFRRGHSRQKEQRVLSSRLTSRSLLVSSLVVGVGVQWEAVCVYRCAMDASPFPKRVFSSCAHSPFSPLAAGDDVTLCCDLAWLGRTWDFSVPG